MRNIFIAFFTALLLCSCGASTPAHKKSKSGIAVLETVRLGGLDHSVLIRGADASGPIILVLHGFAVPMMPFAHLGYADDGGLIEQKYIVVNYDQRGAGKTSRNDTDKSTYNINQYVQDAEELAAYLRKRFNRDKIFLQGVSWGSIIGMHLIQRHPDWFYAYLAEGQASNMQAVYADAAKFARTEAEAEKNEKAVADLSSAGLPDVSRTDSENIKSIEIIVKWLDMYSQKKFHLQDMTGLFFKSIREAPEYSFLDMLALLRSMNSFTENNTVPMLKTDLNKEVPEVKVPVYWIYGEYDLMKSEGKKYYDRLRAPKKKWIEIKGGGHSPSADRPEETEKLYLEILSENAKR